MRIILIHTPDNLLYLGISYHEMMGKYSLLFSCLLALIVLAGNAQKIGVKPGIRLQNFKRTPRILIEPPAPNPIAPVKPAMNLKGAKNCDIVSVLTLGTSANLLGYSGGTRTMLWADYDLNVVANIHRMGPGSSPPSLSGYLGMDLGVNRGATQSDWTNQIQCYAATLSATPEYYDAARYPSAAIYNPSGNTNLSNAYLTFIAPNFANTVVNGFGGYSHGTANLVNPADTTKHLRWYAPPPYTYLPSGFTIAGDIAHMVDIEINAESGQEIYQNGLIYGRGVWNPASHDFDYTFTRQELPTAGSYACADAKIAASLDGNIIWITAIANLAGSTPLNDSSYSIVCMCSHDGGYTWSLPYAIQLDGPDGIDGIKNAYSDYFIEHFFAGPPYPDRDQIPYTTAFDHSITVDGYGNLHVGVVVGYAPGGYSIATGVDSLINVFDIYTCDQGWRWYAVKLGALKTFRGTWGAITSDNRVYTSRDKMAEKLFFTYNDTRVDGEINNQNPDVMARGFSMLTNRITSVQSSDEPNNVTWLCEIMNEAYFQCSAPFVFDNDDGYTIPIAVQWFPDAQSSPTFKYIPDFSFSFGDFTVDVENPYCWVNIEENQDPESDSVAVYPVPVNDFATISLNLNQIAHVLITVKNAPGQQVLSVDKGVMPAGKQEFILDASRLDSGIYFLTVRVNEKWYTRKLIMN